MQEYFRVAANRTSALLGSPWAFIIAIAGIVVWALSGPIFGFNDTWQLIANTGTTLVTFLAVFLIQNTQNRDSTAIHLKLDEIISCINAREELIDIENRPDEDVDRVSDEFKKVAEKCNGTSSVAS